MNRPWLRPLGVSLLVHVLLILGFASEPPWVELDASSHSGAWSSPVTLESYQKSEAAGKVTGQEPALTPREQGESLLPKQPDPKLPEEDPVPETGGDSAPEPEVDSGVESESRSAENPVPENPGVPAAGGLDHPPRLLVGAFTVDQEGAREVQVRIFVGADGRVAEVQPVDPGMDTDLLQEIRRATRSMRFVPATRNGTPVSAWLQLGFVL